MRCIKKPHTIEQNWVIQKMIKKEIYSNLIDIDFYLLLLWQAFIVDFKRYSALCGQTWFLTGE